MHHAIVWQTQDERLDLLAACSVYKVDYHEPFDRPRTLIVYVRDIHELKKVMDYRR